MIETLWPNASDITELSPHQTENLAKALVAKIGLFTGAPGTGKTYTLGRLINHIVSQYGENAIKVAAPTGKAAIRATQSLRAADSSITATTIHRALGVIMTDNGFAFQHTKSNPMTEAFYFVDEASMLGNKLFAQFISAIPDHGHLLFVGDHHQLPPIEKGAVLRDFIEAGIPHGDLTGIFRHSGQIVNTCASIREGRGFIACGKDNPAKYGTEENLKMMEVMDDDQSLAHVKGIYEQLSNSDRLDNVWDVQTIVYINKKSVVAREELNLTIQSILNPDGEKVVYHFRHGDKVICLKNSICKWEEGGEKRSAIVANGQAGRIVSSDKKDVLIEIETSIANVMERITVTREKLMKQWDLGYVCTVHKFQGSSAKLILFVVETSSRARWMGCRQIVYTAISRAEEYCICIGRRIDINKDCQVDAIHKRVTRLAEKTKERIHDKTTGVPVWQGR